MRLIERVTAETDAFHAEADEDTLVLFGPVTAADYQRFLVRSYGFVHPLEVAINATPDLSRFADLRRFHKHQLIRRDLEFFRMSADEIDRIPQCRIPLFSTPEEALGWAFVVERGTLAHTSLFRHLATAIPGDVAFASTYLKCYFGAVGENWRWFGESLDAAASSPAKADRLVDAARTAFRIHRSWRRIQDDIRGGVREQQRA